MKQFDYEAFDNAIYLRNLNGNVGAKIRTYKYLTCSPGDASNACRIVRNVDNIRAPFINVNLDGTERCYSGCERHPDIILEWSSRVGLVFSYGTLVTQCLLRDKLCHDERVLLYVHSVCHSAMRNQRKEFISVCKNLRSFLLFLD